MTFEESLKSLNDIVSRLDSPELSLEESIELYKKGVDMAASCKKQINEAKIKLTEYKNED